MNKKAKKTVKELLKKFKVSFEVIDFREFITIQNKNTYIKVEFDKINKTFDEKGKIFLEFKLKNILVCALRVK